MISSFKQFWKDLFGLVWLALRISLGLLIAVWVFRFFDSPFLKTVFERGGWAWEIVEKLKTAVFIIATFFFGTWGTHFLNKTIFRNRLVNALSLVKGGAKNPLHFLTYAFAHGSDNHLQGNTLMLLLFAAIAFLMVPNLQFFIVATIIILVANGIGILMFAPKGHYIGASGLLLGYFSFLEAYGFGIAQGWQAVVAGIVLLLFGVRIFRMMMNRGNLGTFIGHFWGFVAGLLASRALFMMLVG